MCVMRPVMKDDASTVRFRRSTRSGHSIFTTRCASDNADAENGPRRASRHRSVLFREYISYRSCNWSLYEDLRDAGNKLRAIGQVFYQKRRSHVRQGNEYVARRRRLYRATIPAHFVNVARKSNEYRGNTIDRGKILVGNYRKVSEKYAWAQRSASGKFCQFPKIPRNRVACNRASSASNQVSREYRNWLTVCRNLYSAYVRDTSMSHLAEAARSIDARCDSHI